MARLLYPVPHDAPARIEVDGPRFHHLIHVLRLAVGDELEVFDGRGRSFAGQVAAIGRSSAEISIGQAISAPRARRIVLIQCVPKSDKMEWIVQKGTELGAAVFAPVESARTVVRLTRAKSQQRLERWRTIAEEAARQCGRSDVPEVLPMDGLAARVQSLPSPRRCYALDEEEPALSLGQALAPLLSDPSPVALVIGPEGGFERLEMKSLVALGATPVTLGRNKLRSETAALAALAVVLHLDGRLG
jgi:16S rRNA (uracil1498-N3)-methyltransferase